jgi:transcriptional regulator with XRE-family HTH domain
MIHVMSNHIQTSYQAWLNPALKKAGISLKSLAAQSGMDYTALWKIARGNPAVYPGSARPEYENAVKVGELLGDVEGSLRAANYTPSGVVASVVAEDSGRSEYLAFFDNAPNEEARRRLRIIAEQVAAAWANQEEIVSGKETSTR